MQVIEQHLQGKTDDPQRCEDVIVAGDHFVAVIDGATDKHGDRYQGQTSGRFAALTLAEALKQLAPEATIGDCVDLLSSTLRDAVLAERGGELPAAMPTASIVIYSAARGEIWRVGDTCYRIGEEINAPVKFIDYINGWARRALLDALLLEGADPASFAAGDPGRELIMPILSRQHLFQNLDSDSPFAYGVIDGNPVPARFQELRPLADGEQEIVLTSDGYPVVAPTLAEAEAALEHALASDPLRLQGTPSTKGVQAQSNSFDDRAYIRFRR